MSMAASSPGATDPVVGVYDVSLRYGSTRALDGITLDIPAGCMVGLIGPDGVGKSSLLSLVAGARVIQQGRIEALGGDMAHRDHRRDVCPRIAYMPQGLGKNLYPTLSVFENVDFFGRLFGHGKEEREKRIAELLQSTGMSPFVDRPAGKLSGGMKQKLGLCCALIHDPDLLILDEPTTGMDVNARRAFWESMRAESHRTVLFATHYLEEAQAFADRIVLMNRGRIIADGSTREIRALTNVRTVHFAHDDVASVSPRLTAMPSVTSVVANTHTITVETSDSDALLADVLAWGGHDIEVTAPSLEAAFMALTKETN